MQTNIIILFYLLIMLLLTGAFQFFTSIGRRRHGQYTFRHSNMKHNRDTPHHGPLISIFLMLVGRLICINIIVFAT